MECLLNNNLYFLQKYRRRKGTMKVPDGHRTTFRHLLKNLHCSPSFLTLSTRSSVARIIKIQDCFHIIIWQKKIKSFPAITLGRIRITRSGPVYSASHFCPLTNMFPRTILQNNQMRRQFSGSEEKERPINTKMYHLLYIIILLDFTGFNCIQWISSRDGSWCWWAYHRLLYVGCYWKGHDLCL